MNKMARATVIPAFVVVAAFISSWLVPYGPAEAATQDTECTDFYDWLHIGPDDFPHWHQHHTGPAPWIQRRDTDEWDWFLIHDLEADGRQHPDITPGWTLSYDRAHHDPCEIE